VVRENEKLSRSLQGGPVILVRWLAYPLSSSDCDDELDLMDSVELRRRSFENILMADDGFVLDKIDIVRTLEIDGLRRGAL
jgi:hypothetical protein